MDTKSVPFIYIIFGTSGIQIKTMVIIDIIINLATF